MPTTEMIMLMTLSHCVVVKASWFSCRGFNFSCQGFNGFNFRGFSRRFCFSQLFVCEDDFSLGYFFLCSSRACRVLSAIFLPGSTRFGFLTFVTGVFEVTC